MLTRKAPGHDRCKVSMKGSWIGLVWRRRLSRGLGLH